MALNAEQLFDVGLGLEGVHCIITGATGQIGSVVVKAFLAAGCYVTGFDMNTDKSTIQHERFRIHYMDISSEDSVEHGMELLEPNFGPVCVCVAVAGLDLSFLSHHKTMADMSLEQWNRTINTNLTGSFLTARAWMRRLRDSASNVKNPSLILFSSEAAAMGVKTNADYSASKAGLQGLVASLAPDVVNIHPRARVNAVAPGAVDTPLFRKECREDPDVKYIDSEATVAQKRAVSMESVARTCLFLASEYAASITAQTIRVDGGKSGKVFYTADGRAC